MGTWSCALVLLLALPSALSMPYKDPGSLLYPHGPAYNDQVTDPEDDRRLNAGSNTAKHAVNIRSTSNVGIPGLGIIKVDEFMVPGGCVYGDSFLHYGQTIWIDDGCTTQCSCTHNGKVLCEEKTCSEGLVCLPSRPYYSCQINEDD